MPDVTNWLFGYGSIVNEASRCSTLVASNNSQDETIKPAAWVELSPEAGFVREWNFRAPSGFTAVGMRRDQTNATEISGVLFEVDGALSRFDARETGYERVELDPTQLCVLDGHSAALTALANPTSHRFWTYVPMETHAASDEHPICQTYVDVCVIGCLERGGEGTAEGGPDGRTLAQRWVQTTGGWSEFWLNDAPMSRRPWLHRPRHAEIDGILREQSNHTRFEERRHPEEFSGRWMGSLRGMWGVPPRNDGFVGREAEFARIGSALQQRADGSGGHGSGLSTLELVGMGGVGKTQFAIEYCYRHFAAASSAEPGGSMSPVKGGRHHHASTSYGLVIWLRAESAEALAADLRSLAIDSGIGVQGLRNEEVVEEVRGRLFRTRTPWLLVLDNVSRGGAETSVLPRGCHGVGHVLITSRELANDGHQPGHATGTATSVVQLGCLSTSESLALLRRVGGEHLGADDPLESSYGRAEVFLEEPQPAGAAVAEKLGNLPLALGLAAAYMRACDVSCNRYLHRLAGGARGAEAAAGAELLQGYARGVAESFELSLSQLDTLDTSTHGASADDTAVAAVSARRVLDVLAFCASEGIPKALLTAAALPPPPQRPVAVLDDCR